MQIRFFKNETANTFNLVDNINVSPSRLQATIFQENFTMEFIAECVKDNTEIQILDDSEIIGIYEGYSDLFALSMYYNQDDEVVSIELMNADIESQIDNLSVIQTQQGTAIDTLNEEMSTIHPYVVTKTAYIGDTEVIFEDVPDGALVVSFANGNRVYSITRENENLKVEFEPLNEVTDITISVQQ